MISMNGKKVAMIGMDAIIPVFANRMIEEGKLPNLQKLRDQGFWSELIPTVPAWTPTGWATVATGAAASTHGIEGFFIHVPGEDYDVEHPGFDSRRCRAEFVWDTALRHGKNSILLKYPGSWPPLSPGVTQVGGGGGYGGLQNELAISHAVCYTNNPEVEHGRPILLTAAAGWSELPTGATPLLEAELAVVFNRPAQPLSFWLLIFTDAANQATALISKSKSGADAVAILHEGGWSEHIFDTWHLDEGEFEGAFRLKLVELNTELQQVRLFMSQNLPKTGYCRPTELDDALWDAVGPPMEYTAYKHLFWNWIDLPTQMEVYEQHVDWLSRATDFLFTNQEWDLYYTQLHILDYAEHIFWGGFDPLHPDFDAAQASDYWQSLEQTYDLADQFIGAVMAAAGDDAVVMVVGDHGHQPYRWTFYPNNLLAEQGLLHVEWDEKLGRMAVDWSKTKAYGYGPVHIAINLEGRDPQGIVPSEEYEELREQIVDLLYDVKHEATGKRPVKLAITREEADFFGLYGDGVGDIIFFTRAGYDSGNAQRMGQSPGYDPEQKDGQSDNPLAAGVTEDRELFKPTQIMKEMTSEHPSQMPSEKLTRSLLCMAGPGVRQGVVRQIPTSILNVTATVCELLQIPYPEDNEGLPIVDALVGKNS